MKLQNSTDYPDAFLRRMVVWCCRELELPVRRLRRVTFRNTKGAFSGLGGGRGIIVRIGPESRYPVPAFTRHGVLHPAHTDRLEGLVSTTAHEVFHCWQSFKGGFRGSRHDEPAAIAAEKMVLYTFREQRDALLADWSRSTVKPTKARPSIRERNEEKARQALERWQRKLKLAQTKVRKYRAAVRRYERLQAATNSAQQAEKV